jgi:hypothetical protein
VPVQGFVTGSKYIRVTPCVSVTTSVRVIP